MSAKPPFSRVSIFGSGLIGTSIGLALTRLGCQVTMIDRDPRAQAIAQSLVGGGGGNLSDSELVISAVPISAFSQVISALEGSTFSGVFIDTGSVKSKPVLEISTSRFHHASYLPSHPMAGREVSGAESARADLFEGRPWVIDSSEVSPQTLEWGIALIEGLGAHVVDMPVAEHDQAVALVSHLPQLVASLLAKQLLGKPEDWVALAGGGLRDTTRIAGSDSALWKEIIASNSQAIAPLLKALASDVSELVAKIEDESFIAGVIDQGQVGRASIPGKHGGKARDYTYLPIVIEDKAGQLAAIFNECAQVSVNIEDLAIEHSPGQQTGLITLALSHGDALILQSHLISQGWDVHPPRS